MKLGWLGLIAMVLVFCAISWRAARAREIVVLSVSQGRTRIARGRAPASLIDALSDVFARSAIQHATVKVLRDNGRVRLTATGLDPQTLQRARNVLGTYPAHRLGSR